MADMSSEIFSERYELVRHIARGGMAQVYLAQDLLLDRPVAIKVLFPELSSDPSFVERFRREAQAAANLSHANIVSIYDWGQGEHTYFIVMEYIDGQTLSSVVRQGPLAPGRAAAIGADIANALDFAHRRGVIHRDVKPGNVLIDRAGQVKVADFGIARAVSHASEGLTQTGAVMGTATYFSPEQAQGQPVDARSDVYSLGVVLYETLTGRPPFSGDSPVAIAYKHVREYPPLPSEINPAVPPELEAIVMSAMAKDPDERYQTAADLRDDLARFQQGQPVLAAHPGSAPPTRAVGGPPPYYAGYDPTYVGGHDTGTFGPSDVYAPPPEPPRRSRTGWWASLFLVLLAVLGVLVFFIGRNAGWWGSPSNILVPAVKSQGVPQAEATLVAAGFRSPALHYETTALVPKGLAIGTVPAAGANVPPATVITLDVSSGPPQLPVPGLSNLTCVAAEAQLRSKDFVPKNVPRNSDTVKSGLVISTNPAAGVKDAEGNTVTIYCSAGRATTTVPNVQGLSPGVAGARLFAAHLVPNNTVQTEPSNTIKVGFVIRTDPSQGNIEPWGTKVTLFVSGGPAQTTVPPNLVGETLAQAQKELLASGLTWSVEQQTVHNPSQNGNVLQTNPTPGSSARQGQAVTLIIGQYVPALATSTTTTTTSPAATTTPASTTPPASTVPASTTSASTSTPASTSTTASTSTPATTASAAGTTSTTAPAAPPGPGGATPTSLSGAPANSPGPGRSVLRLLPGPGRGWRH